MNQRAVFYVTSAVFALFVLLDYLANREGIHDASGWDSSATVLFVVWLLCGYKLWKREGGQ